MTDDLGQLVHLLRNTPVRELITALRRDGFSLERQTRTGGRIYGHPDGRLTTIHYHTGRDTLTRKTLRSVLQATRWTETDLRRLGLLPWTRILLHHAKAPASRQGLFSLVSFRHTTPPAAGVTGALVVLT